MCGALHSPVASPLNTNRFFGSVCKLCIGFLRVKFKCNNNGRAGGVCVIHPRILGGLVALPSNRIGDALIIIVATCL